MSDDFTTKLGGMSAAIKREVAQSMFAAGEMVAVAAQLSITRGSVSGKNHQPSAPGQPPSNDTGVLAGNIEVVQTKQLEVEISSNAPYAASLEFGTSKMGARPYMGPAARAQRPAVERLLARATARAVRKHFRS